jgi:hypothetical protein
MLTYADFEMEGQMRGIDTLDGMRRLAEEVDKNWDGVLAKLLRIRDLLVDRRNLIVRCFTGCVALLALLAAAQSPSPCRPPPPHCLKLSVCFTSAHVACFYWYKSGTNTDAEWCCAR